MLEQDDHFKHLYDNPTYIRPEDWRSIDKLVDWLIEKNRAGYQMVNSVQRLKEIKAFVRMSSGLDLKEYGWNGDGTGGQPRQTEAARRGYRELWKGRMATSVRGMELPRRPKQRHHTDRWHGGAVLPDVRRPHTIGETSTIRDSTKNSSPA